MTAAGAAPRRASQAASDDLVDIIEVATETRGRARRTRRDYGRAAVASALAAVLAATSMLGYAFVSAGNASADSQAGEAANVAIPAAAFDATSRGFSDRAQEASRDAVRGSLASGIADETKTKEREASIDAAAEKALEEQTASSAAERDRLMDEDLKLVAAQEEKLKKEAEEAARRLAEAKAAAEQAGLTSGLSEDEISELSADLAAAVTSSGGSMPVKSNYRVGAGFGDTGSWSRYHTGQDFPAPTGTPIYAAASGIVLSPTAGGWAGISVTIQHGGQGSTLYAHMSRSVVSPGQAVQAGQLIGYVGNTGRSIGSHLHFEYYRPGVTPGDVYHASNPMSFLRTLGIG